MPIHILPGMKPTLNDAQRAHLGLRLVMGLNIMLHGLVRFGHLDAFAESLVTGFANTPLPAGLVRLFALTLPFFEAAIGLLLLLGLKFRLAVLAGFAVLASLTLGTVLREQWETAGLQLVYALAYFALTLHASHLRLALDPKVNPS